MTYLTILIGLLGYAILTQWVAEGWAWAAFQTGTFTVTAVWITHKAVVHEAAQSAQFRTALPQGICWNKANFVALPLAGVVFWGLGQIAAHRTICGWETWKSVVTWTTWLAVFFLAAQLLRDAGLHRRFLRGVAIFGAILSVFATVQMFTSGGRIFWLFPSGYPDFILGPFTNRNQYAAWIELLLPIALAECLRDRKRWLLWCSLACGMFASVIAAASRAGLLIATAEIVAVLAIAAARVQVSGRSAQRIAAACAGLALVFTLVVGWETIWTRLSDPDPYAGRREMLVSSLQMIRERPWTGFGLGTWPIAYPRFALYDDGTVVNQAHNDWVQWTVEGGLPFLAILLVLAIPAIRPALSSLWGIGVLAVMAHALVDFPFQQRPALGAWFFAVLGALAARTGSRPQRC